LIENSTVILRSSIAQRRVSALGQKRTFNGVSPMSALPSIADIGGAHRDVRFVPKADN
jgi:hypothetical protein